MVLTVLEKKPKKQLLNQLNNMPQDITIKITDREGVTHEVQAPTDMNMSIMELVRAYELAPEGTIGICGGMAMCASCQCYVLNDIPLPEKGPDEEAMLWEAFNVKENSRLGCQIHITEAIDGLAIELAPEA
jgi:2Fe-2S ferredoxin